MYDKEQFVANSVKSEINTLRQERQHFHVDLALKVAPLYTAAVDRLVRDTDTLNAAFQKLLADNIKLKTEHDEALANAQTQKAQLDAHNTLAQQQAVIKAEKAKQRGSFGGLFAARKQQPASLLEDLLPIDGGQGGGGGKGKVTINIGSLHSSTGGLHLKGGVKVGDGVVKSTVGTAVKNAGGLASAAATFMRNSSVPPPTPRRGRR